MVAPQTWTEVPEAEAGGEIAVLYDDIRAATGIPLVNLVYRYIASVPGGLDETWRLLRPLYASGVFVARSAGLSERVNALDTADRFAQDVGKAGLCANELDAIADVLELYAHANTVNLLAMSVLGELLRFGRSTGGARGQQRRSARNYSFRPVKPLPAMDALNAAQRDLALSLGRCGQGGQSDFVEPSLFRHLAYWPAFLEAIHPRLSTLDKRGELAAATHRTSQAASSIAATIMRETASPRMPLPDPRVSAQVQEIVSHFASVTIPRLLPVCFILREAVRQIHGPRPPGC